MGNHLAQTLPTHRKAPSGEDAAHGSDASDAAKAEIAFFFMGASLA